MDYYYRFVIPNRSLIELGRTTMVLNDINEKFNIYTSRYWELICRKFVSGNTINGITYNVAARWWGNVSRDEIIEIDIVAQSIDKKTILIGECKWSCISNGDALIAHLTEKAKKLPFTKGRKIAFILFVKDCKELNHNILTAEDIVFYNKINNYSIYHNSKLN